MKELDLCMMCTTTTARVSFPRLDCPIVNAKAALAGLADNLRDNQRLLEDRLGECV